MDIAPQSAAADRFATLTRTTAFDTPDETSFDSSLRVAAHLAGVQMAVICLHAEHRHWVRSELGPDLRQAVQASRLHAAALAQDGPFIVADAAADPAFAEDGLVTGPWQLRFFAAVKLHLRGGRVIGVLCLADPEPHELDALQIAALHDLARTVTDQIALRVQATTDGLTGVYTRRYIGCYLEPEVARCRRHGNQLSAIAIDLDQVKGLNTRLGRPAGDIWIRAVVSSLRSTLRFSDLVARVGGGAFLALLPETPAEGAMLVAERARRSVAALRLPFAEAVISGTASFGVSTLLPQDRHVADLLRRLDAALDRAKQAGCNSVMFEGQLP